jgi:hypothetical protein
LFPTSRPKIVKLSWVKERKGGVYSYWKEEEGGKREVPKVALVPFTRPVRLMGGMSTVSVMMV